MQINLKTHYYQQFDADHTRDVPGEGYGGWRTEELPIETDHTALVVMHAWNTGTPEEYPGWWRAVEYMGRAQRICREVFPELLAAVRRSPLPIFHVVGGGKYYQHYPGYRHARALTGETPGPPEQIDTDETLRRLHKFRTQNAFVGEHNEADVRRGFNDLDFDPNALPQGDEGVAENGPQLFGLCREAGVNHLIYAGFAVNWCLLLSPGGMAEMTRHGILCSALREAVTAVENKETARQELCKQMGLWRVALAYGFVYDVADFVAAVGQAS